MTSAIKSEVSFLNGEGKVTSNATSTFFGIKPDQLPEIILELLNDDQYSMYRAICCLPSLREINEVICPRVKSWEQSLEQFVEIFASRISESGLVERVKDTDWAVECLPFWLIDGLAEFIQNEPTLITGWLFYLPGTSDHKVFIVMKFSGGEKLAIEDSVLIDSLVRVVIQRHNWRITKIPQMIDKPSTQR